MKYDVFISHKSEDESIAKELYKFLQINELTVFLADKSLNESDYKEQIDKALEDSKNLVAITTKAEYLESKWVKYEWNTFLKEILSDESEGTEYKQIFTIIDNKIKRKDLPLSLRTLQYFYLSEYKDKLLSFLKKEIISEQPNKKLGQKILKELSKLKDGLLAIFSVGIIIILIFSVFFSAGFGYTHFSERKYDKLYDLAYENVKLQENEKYGYFLLETEDAYYDLKESTIIFIPKTTKTTNVYEAKRNEIIKDVSLLGIGSLVTTLFNVKIKGNNKQTVWLYIGGTIAIICGYGVGHQVSLKRYPVIESDRMKEFLSEEENWQMIIDKKTVNQ
jgi:hypothetical protein